MGGNVFVNPPYGRSIGEFIKKAYEEHLRDPNRFIVMLVPSRTDTRYWQDYVINKATIKYIRGRLKFEVNGIATDAAPFPSVLLVYGM
nr:phage N-6-adenine-methyltransferase [Leuconostoc gasicomitatum]